MAKDKYVQILSVPKRVARMNALIKSVANDHRKLLVYYSCFKGLLLVRHQTVRAGPILYLIKRWDIARECFVLPDGREWVIKDEDVARVYGLPYGVGKAPISIEHNGDEYRFSDDVLSKYNIQVQNVKDSKMKQLLMSETLSREDRAEDFWRFYVLYALSSLLIPCSAPNISHRYLKFLETPQMASDFNWAALVKDKLVDGLNSYKAKIENKSAPTARPNGDMHCLMHMFYDFLDSKNLSERSFTCSLKRNISLKDVQSVFEPPVPGELVGSTRQRVSSNCKTIVQLETDEEVKDDEAELQFHKLKDKCEKEIFLCDLMITKYTKRKKECEEALAELVLKHEVRKKKYTEQHLAAVKVEEVTGKISDMEHSQRKRQAQTSGTGTPMRKKYRGQSKSLSGKDCGVLSNLKDAAEACLAMQSGKDCGVLSNLDDDAAELTGEKFEKQGKLRGPETEGRYVMYSHHLVKIEKD